MNKDKRKTLVAGNWKMHLNVSQSSILLSRLQKHIAGHRDVEVVVAPSLLSLQPLSLQIDRRKLRLAAQNANAKDEGALTGLWRQVEIDCAGPQPSEPVRELEFRAPGRFWVTFLPFETYRDYWGEVDFDPAAGRLSLTVEGGNSEPENAILSGPADYRATLTNRPVSSTDDTRLAMITAQTRPSTPIRWARNQPSGIITRL